MIFVGLMGGATYANCMYVMNNDPGVPNYLREQGVNLSFMLSNIGIMCASGLSILFDNTIMKS